MKILSKQTLYRLSPQNALSNTIQFKLSLIRYWMDAQRHKSTKSF